MLRRFALVALAALTLMSAPAQAQRVLIVPATPIPPNKFVILKELAQPRGIELVVQYAEKFAPDSDARVFAGYDAVFFDAPREQVEEAIRNRLARALPGLKARQLWLNTQHPRWNGWDEGEARQLLAYYGPGGRANFTAFLDVLAARLAGRAPASLPAPVVFPNVGIFHPDAGGQVFTTPAEFLAWKNPAGKPVIGIATFESYLNAEQTLLTDDLVRRIEAGGAVAMPFYGTMMGKLAPLLTVAGKPIVDAVISVQLVYDPENRRAELEKLGVPVLTALTYRKGGIAGWRADPQGLTLSDVPFYLSQAEYAGAIDPIMVAAMQNDQPTPIPEQTATLVAKALNLVKLQRKANADKQLAILFWNYPPGEKNLSASFLNLPKSLQATLTALKAAGYATSAPEEKELIAKLQRLLAPQYRDGELAGLLRDDLAERFPVADYRRWLAAQPIAVREQLQSRWGDPEKSAMVIREKGEAYFVVPRFKLGHIAILPQAPRGERWEDKEKAIYHSPTAAPSHFYLASYLWARQQHKADALIHFGTHGSQEWLPGKERALSVYDYPLLALGDVPVIYPYIADNIGEALQTKRRGRAVVISHQTPSFNPAGLHGQLNALHDLLHAWINQDQGAVKDQQASDLVKGVIAQKIHLDLGWDKARIEHELPAFVTLLHDHLHELAQTAQPAGLHSFGMAPDDTLRLNTVAMMLGKPFWERTTAAGQDSDEVFVGDYRQQGQSRTMQLLQKHVLRNEAVDGIKDVALRADLLKGREYYAAIGAQHELPALLAALSGRHIPTSYGGDPIRSPDAYPTGRNLYGFDPSRVPTKQAWEAGKKALDALLAEHRKAQGKTPDKLAFSLWSVETMRHQGILEAQAFWALGVEPVWDDGGRLINVQLVDRQTLGHPRVDVVLSATGLYRDHFPNVMKWLALAVKLAAEAKEADNPVAINTQKMLQKLARLPLPDDAKLAIAQTRIFSNASGRYGTGLDDATLASDTWKGEKEGDRKLAELYLSRMQHAYGPDEKTWGALPAAGVNLYAEALRGTQGAVLARSSNLYGMLTTDDPFQYLGGIGLAVRHLDGKAPQLYIANLRDNAQSGGKVENAAGFLAKELATRNFHPGYIEGLMKEGYAGTLQVLDGVNNFWGWQATAREIVRDDQWQEFVDVYVRDKHQLGLNRWFEKENPHALAQTIERMLEASRQGYWQADAQTIRELKTRWRDLARRFDVKTDNTAFNQFVAQGFGMDFAPPSQAGKAQADAQSAPRLVAPPPPPAVRGMQLEKILPPDLPTPVWGILGFIFIVLALAIGGARQWRVGQVRHSF